MRTSSPNTGFENQTMAEDEQDNTGTCTSNILLQPSHLLLNYNCDNSNELATCIENDVNRIVRILKTIVGASPLLTLP
jgi:hypothetical protein